MLWHFVVFCLLLITGFECFGGAYISGMTATLNPKNMVARTVDKN
jgi:hypothetical protein